MQSNLSKLVTLCVLLSIGIVFVLLLLCFWTSSELFRCGTYGFGTEKVCPNRFKIVPNWVNLTVRNKSQSCHKNITTELFRIKSPSQPDLLPSMTSIPMFPPETCFLQLGTNKQTANNQLRTRKFRNTPKNNPQQFPQGLFQRACIISLIVAISQSLGLQAIVVTPL